MRCQPFHDHWSFWKEDAPGGRQAAVQVTLPHDAMLLERRDPLTPNGPHTGYFPGGVYHYARTFSVPAAYREKTVLFFFEGVYMDAEVLINGQRAGGRPYGYSEFTIDPAPFLVYGADNQIEVVARNDCQPNSRWYTGSGIYRPVHLLVGGRLHILPGGVRITTLSAMEGQALVEVSAAVTNDGPRADDTRLAVELLDASGAPLASGQAPFTVLPGQTVAARLELAVPAPALWSPEAPNLYTCRLRLMAGGEVVDEDGETFGIRTLALDAQHGLRLNGRPLKLRGGCIHHDHGVIGTVELPQAALRRARILKEAGFNAIRSAHNPISRAMLDACDRLGLLVMDEAFDTWLDGKTACDYARYFEDWWEQDIAAMVARDYNHPCVILYSIGNEVGETAGPRGADLARRLAAHVRALDPSRYTIVCINGIVNLMAGAGQTAARLRRALGLGRRGGGPADTKKRLGRYINQAMDLLSRHLDAVVSLPLVDRLTREAFAAVDVAGYNYMKGRYRRDAAHYPERVLCGSETQSQAIAAGWKLVKQLPALIGEFTWTAWDYLGEAGLGLWRYDRAGGLYAPYPCLLAGCGDIDITGQRGPQSYYREIVWGLRADPYIAVQRVDRHGARASRSFWRGSDVVASWTWPGCAGRPAVVEVYAGADEVELLLNGRSLGRAPAGEERGFKAIFKTIYEPGELSAVAYRAGRESGRCSLRTAGEPARLELCCDLGRLAGEGLRAGGADLAYLDIAIVDGEGIVNPAAERVLTINVEGAGTLLGFGSAAPWTEESFADGEHTTYEGRALAVIRAGAQPGEVRVTVSAAGMEPARVTIPVKA